METELNSLDQALVVLLIATLAHALLLRRLTRSWIDPLVYTALGPTTALALTYALVGTTSPWFHVLFSVLAFWLGVLLAWPWRVQTAPLARVASAADGDRKLARFLTVGTVVFLAANFFFFIVSGPPALAENPTLAKVESYAGGFGIVRRLNWGLGPCIIFGLTYSLLTRPNRSARWAYGLCLLVVTGSGSKGAFLPILFSASLLLNHPAVHRKGGAPSLKLPIPLPALIVAAAVVAFGVLLSETGGPSQAGIALMIRVLYSSDVMFYWTDRTVHSYFVWFDGFDYLTHMLGPILSALRLTDNTIPLGALMVQRSLGLGQAVSESLGPNVPFFVKGELFFGWAAYLYALAIGYLIGHLRKSFVQAKAEHPLRLCFLGTLVLLSPALAIDDALFLSTLIDFVVAFYAVYLLSQALPVRRRKVVPQAQSDQYIQPS